MLGVKGTDPGRSVSPVIAASMELADQYQPEGRYTRGERSWAIGFQTVVSTANFPFWTVANPAGSGKLSVLRRVTVSLQVPVNTVQGGQLFFTVFVPQVGVPAPIANMNLLDGRQQTINANASTYYATNLSTGAGTINSNAVFSAWGFELNPVVAGIVLPQVIVSPDLDLIMPPNTAVRIGFSGTVLATAGWTWSAAVAGYERVADPNEFNPPSQ